MIQIFRTSIFAVILGLFITSCVAFSGLPDSHDTTLAPSQIYVDFENAAYTAGDIYDAHLQAYDWKVLGTPTRMQSEETTISYEAAASGMRALKVIYKANEQAVKQTRWQLAGAQSYTLEYKVRFAPDFIFNGQDKYKRTQNGGKLPGLAGRGVNGSLCSGGMSCHPGGGFSARLMWRTDGQAVLYLYDYTKSIAGKVYGEDIAFSDGVKFIPGRWHHIRQTVTLNTPGKADGRIDIDMDGAPVVRMRNREVVTSGEDIDMVLFSTFFGGNSLPWFPATDQTAYFDDFRVTSN